MNGASPSIASSSSKGKPSLRPSSVTFRNPTVEDGYAIWELVSESGVLEPNTAYAYLLLSTHFSQTCLVAEEKGRLVAFVAAYVRPTKPETVFVWQIGVRSDARGQGLGGKLLDALVQQPACASVRFLEATVGISNEASKRLFLGFARRHESRCELGRGYLDKDFGPLHHESEPLYRIGPFKGSH